MVANCCGEDRNQRGVATNSQPPLFNGGTITNQPTFQPAFNGVFQQPTLSPPPAAHSNTLAPNGLQQQPAWGQSQSPPPMNEFGATPLSHMTAVPTYTGTTYNGSNFDVAKGFSSINQPIPRPQSSHPPHSPPPQLTAPIQDEGKMSISIDFGTYQHVISLQTLILVQVQHFLVL